MKITAKGKINKKNITITVTRNNDYKYNFEFSDCDSRFFPTLERLLKQEMKSRYIFAGTYVPPVWSDINIMNVLESHFFDEVDFVHAEDIDEMPHEEGVIY